MPTIGSLRAEWRDYLDRSLDREPGMIGPVPYLLVLRAINLLTVFLRFVLPTKRAGGPWETTALIVTMSVVEAALIVAHYKMNRAATSRGYRSIMFASVIVDVLLISWAYRLTATPVSDFFVFYFLPILTASEYLPLLSTLAGFAVVLTGLGFTLSSFHQVETFDLITMGLMRGGSLILFATVSIFRTRLLRAQNRDLLEWNRHTQTLLDFQKRAGAHFEFVNDNLVNWMLRHLTEDLDFDFAGVAAVDLYHRRVSMIRSRNIPPGWMQRTSYSLDESDILVDIVRKGKAELLAGFDPRFNKTIFQLYGHSNLARIFAPLVDDGTE
jgi:hypothetical protein